MRMSMFRCRTVAALIAAAGTVVVAGASARATTIAVGSTEEMVDRADAIVRATVVNGSAQAQWDAPRQFIFTRTTLRITESLDGVLPAGAEITVEAPGGFITDENVGLVIPGSPNYQDGQEVIAFLVLGADQMLRTLDMSAGKFEIEREGGEEFVTRKDLGGEGVKLVGAPGAEPAPRRGVAPARTSVAELKGEIAQALATKSQRTPIAALEANGKKIAGPIQVDEAAQAAKRAAAERDAAARNLPRGGAEGVNQ